jgi:hypothetical protein
MMLVASGVSVAQTSSSARPLPPTNICLDDVCPSAAPAGAKKWNPGHYVRPDEQGWLAKRSSRYAVYETIRDVPQVKGAAFIVNWGMVENARGVYDWSQVDAEINYLAAMGKKAILDLWYLGFAGTVPSVPQGADYRYVGDYLISDGCVSNVSYGGYGARLDIAKCMDRWIAFIQAAAARYDNNPNVESVHISETSTNMVGQNHDLLAQQWLRVPPALKASFTRTHTVLHNNYLGNVASSRALTAAMVANGVGMGGPDIIGVFRLPQDPNKDNWGALEIRGAGEVPGVGTFGTVDNRLRVPSSWEAQVVRPVDLRPADVNAYANTMLKSNHTIWTAYLGYAPSQYGGTQPVPTMRWDGTDGVLAFLKQPANAVTNTACPLAYEGACVK